MKAGRRLLPRWSKNTISGAAILAVSALTFGAISAPALAEPGGEVESEPQVSLLAGETEEDPQLWDGANKGTVRGGTWLELPVREIEGFVDADMQGNHTIAYDRSGTIWGWGQGAGDVLGNGSPVNRTTPTKANMSSVDGSAISVSTAVDFSLAQISETAGADWGDPAAWGSGIAAFVNSAIPSYVSFTLGTGTDTKPILFDSLDAGFTHGVGIGTVLGEDATRTFAFGSNTKGELGNGSTSPVVGSATEVLTYEGGQLDSVIAAAGDRYSIAQTENGNERKIWFWGRYLGSGSIFPQETYGTSAEDYAIPSMPRFVDLSAGKDHVLAVDSEGSLWSWGYNTDGQLGDGTLTDRIAPARVDVPGAPAGGFIKVAAGATHSVAVDVNGNVWTWGGNDSGQLGVPLDVTQTLVPTQRDWANMTPPAGTDPSLVVTDKTKFKNVSASTNGSIFIAENGVVWGVGSNASGQLGNGSTSGIETYPIPAKVPPEYAGASFGDASSFPPQAQWKKINLSKRTIVTPTPEHESGPVRVWIRDDADGADAQLDGYFLYTVENTWGGDGEIGTAAASEEFTARATVSNADLDNLATNAQMKFTYTAPGAAPVTRTVPIDRSTGLAEAPFNAGEPGEATLTAVVVQNVSGFPEIGSQADVSNLLTQTITVEDVQVPACGATASRLEITPSAGMVFAGGEQYTATARVVDANGDALPGVNVAFEVESGLVPEGELTQATGDGGSASIKVSADNPGSYSVSATLVDFEDCALGNSPATVEFVAGGPFADNSSFTVSTAGEKTVFETASEPNNEDNYHLIDVTLKDRRNQPVTGLTADDLQSVALTATSDVSRMAFSALTETSTPGVYQAKVWSEVAGTKTIVANLGGVPLQVTTNGTDSAAFSPGEINYTCDESEENCFVTTLTGSDDEALADGQTPLWVEVKAVDRFGNHITGQTIELSYAPELDPVGEGGNGGTITVTTGAGGLARAEFTSDNIGEFDVASVPADLIVGSPHTLHFVAGDALPVFTVSTGEVSVDSAEGHTITVTSTDGMGHTVPLSADQLSARVAGGDPDNAVTLTGFAEKEGEEGVYTATITSTKPGEYPIEVLLDGDEDAIHLEGNGTAIFIAGSPVFSGDNASSITGEVGSVVADGVQTRSVTVQLVDQYGNPVPGYSVTIDGAGLTATAALTGNTDTDGRFSVPFTSLVAGVFDVTATAGEENDPVVNGSPAKLTFVAGAPDADKSSFKVDPTPAIAGSGQAVELTVVLNDANNNPVLDYDGSGLQAYAAPSAGVSLGGNNYVNVGDGTYTLPITSSVVNHNVISVTLNDTELDWGEDNNIATFIAGAVSQQNSSYSVTNDADKKADGVDTQTVTAILKDAYGNAVSGQAGHLAASGLPNGLTFQTFAEAGSTGVYTATITSTVADLFTVDVAYGDDPAMDLDPSPAGAYQTRFVAGEPNFTCEEGDPTCHVSALNVSETAAVADGEGTVWAEASLVDRYGNPVANRDVTFATTPDGPTAANFTVTSDSQGIAHIDLTSTQAGQYKVSATVGGIIVAVPEGNNDTATFIAGSGVPQFFVSEGNAIADGADPHTITVRVTDANGNPTTLDETLLAANSSAPESQQLTFSAFSPQGEVGSGLYTATVTSTRSGVFPIQMTYDGSPMAGVTGENTDAVFVAGPAVAIESSYTVDPTAVPAGGNVPVTLDLRDASGNPALMPASGFSATVAEGATLSGFEADVETPGRYMATVTSQIVGDYQVAASINGTDIGAVEGQDTAHFVAGMPNAEKSTYQVDPEAVQVGGQVPVTVTLRDEYGNFAALPEGMVLQGTAVGSATVGAFTGTGSTYTAQATSQMPGSYEVAVTLDGLAVTLPEGTNKYANFTEGDVDLDTSSFAVTNNSDQKVGEGIQTLTVILQDQYGNSLSGHAAALSAAGAPGGLSFTGAVGQFTETEPGVYTSQVTSTVAGDFTVTVSHAVAGGLSANPTTADQTSFVAGDPFFGPCEAGEDCEVTRLVLAGSPAIAGAQEVTATVTVVDKFGNKVPGAAVTFATDDGPVVSPQATVTSNAQGIAQVTYTSADKGTFPVAATVDGTPAVDSPQDMRFIAGDGAPLYSVTTGEKVADGVQAHTITVVAKDSNGVALDVDPELLAATSTAADLSGLSISAFEPVPGQEGTYTASVVSTKATDFPIAVSYDGEAIASQAEANTVARFIAGDAVFAESDFTVSEEPSVVDGQVSLTVNLRDAHGNPAELPVSGLDAVLPTEVTLASGFVGSGGTYTAQVTSTKAGDYQLGIMLGTDEIGVADSGNDTAHFIAGPAVVENSAFAVDPTPVSTGNSVPVTLTLEDAYGNPALLPGSGLVATVPAEASIGAFDTTSTPGVYQARVTSTQVGDYQVSISIGGTGVAATAEQDTAHFIAGVVSEQTSFFRVTNTDGVVADGNDPQTLTVTLRDQYDNPVTGQQELLGCTGTPQGLLFAGFTEDAPGVYTENVTSRKAGDFALEVMHGSPVTAFIAPEAEGANKTHFVAGEPNFECEPNAEDCQMTRLSIGHNPISVEDPDGIDAWVTVVDRYGNLVEGATVDFTVDSPLAIADPEGPVVTGPSGEARVNFTSNTAGTYQVSATVNGTTTADSPQSMVFTAGAGVPQYTVSTGTRVAGVEYHSITVTAKDAAGNPLEDFDPEQLAVTTDPAGEVTVSAFEPELSSPGVFTATITANAAGTYGVFVAYQDQPIGLDGNGDAVFIAGPPSADRSSLEVSADPVAAGGDVPVTLTLRDANDNPALIDSSVSATVEDGASLGGFIYSGTPGVYTSTVTSTIAGSYQVQALIGTDPVTVETNDRANFIAGPASGEHSTYEVDDTITPVGDTVPVTVELKDRYGNPATISDPASLAGQATPGSVSAFTGAGSTYVAQVSSTVAGDSTVTVALDGMPISVTAAGKDVAHFVAGVPVAANSTFQVSQEPDKLANGTDQQTVTVTLRDANNNLAALPEGWALAGLSQTVAGFTASVGDFTGTGSEFGAPITALGGGDYKISVTLVAAGGQTADVTAVVNDIASFGYVQSDPPVITETTPTEVTGTGNPGSTITVTGPDGEDLGSTVVEEDGTWTVIFQPKPEPETDFEVTQTTPGKSESDPAPGRTPEKVPSEKPVVNPPTENGVDGSGTPGAEITVTGPEGPLCAEGDPIIVGDDGSWSCTFTEPQEPGTEIDVTQTEPDKGPSEEVTVVVPERPSPEPSEVPTVNTPTENEVTGTGVPGAEITVTGPDGPLCVVDVDDQGNWKCEFPTPQEPGSEITVTQQENGKTPSEEVTVTIPIPGQSDKPIITGITPGDVSGTGTAGSTVVITGPDGEELGQVVVENDGTWTVTFEPELAPGTVIEAVQTTPGLLPSDPAPATVPSPNQTQKPGVDEVTPESGSGTGVPGAEIEIRDPETEEVLCETTVAPDGTWTCVFPEDKQPEVGGEVDVTQKEDGKDTSEPETVVVSPVPVVPVPSEKPGVDEITGENITGTGVPGAEITVTGPEGPLCVVEVDDQGRWECEFPTPLDPDTEVTVTQQEGGKLPSEPETAVVPAAPAAPSADHSTFVVSGAQVPANGQASHTVTVTVRDQYGAPIALGEAQLAATSEQLSRAAGVTIGDFRVGDAENIYIADITSTVPGSFQIAVTLDGSALSPDGNDIAVFAEVPGGTSEKPVVNPPTENGIDGTGKPGAEIEVTGPEGPLCAEGAKIVVGADGTWSCTFTNPQKPGTEIEVTQTEKDKEPSEPVIVVVPEPAQPGQSEKPIVNPPTENGVDGKGKPGAEITVTGPEGELCKTTVDQNGNWSCSFPGPLKPGTEIQVTQKEEGKDPSAPVVVKIPDPQTQKPGSKPSEGLSVTGGTVAVVGSLAGVLLLLGLGLAGLRRKADRSQ